MVKKYNIVYADPPYPQRKGGLRKVRPNQTRHLDYPTMTLEDIEKLLKRFDNKYTQKECTFFIWTIDKYLFETEHIMKRLGYKLHARIIWDKENGIAPAFTIRFAHEYLLWFYKGKMMPLITYRGTYTSVIREKARRHSQKPEKAYQFIENIYPLTKHKKIELFARNRRDKWDSWGNEVVCDIERNL